jgi:hypothetical protein
MSVIYPAQESGSSNSKFILLLVAVLALLGSNVFLYMRLNDVKSEVADLRAAAETQIAGIKTASTSERAESQEKMEALRAELGAARQQAAVAVGRAKTDAERHADKLAQQLATEQRKQKEQIATEITLVKEETSARFEDVNTDVTNVRTEVASAKSEIDQTIQQLRSVTGDMGVMSGLIATNANELQALRALGDRNYFEFDLGKTKDPQKVGTVAVKLRKVDTKRNRYTVELTADDKRVEKKDKTINEPVQFYVTGYRQPFEMVVNSVNKDRISGYISAPKVQAARN